jgi:hypothetical protein
MRSVGLALALGLGLTGCIKPVELRTIRSESEENELAAAEKYEGKRWRVAGMVVRTGQDVRQVVDHELHDVGLETTGTSRRVTEKQPYVMIAPPDGEGGVAGLCYFDINDRADVAELQKGSNVELDCVFQGYRSRRTPPTLIFRDCSIGSIRN